MKEMLKYIKLYETECEYIIHKGANKKIEKKADGEDFTSKKLI